MHSPTHLKKTKVSTESLPVYLEGRSYKIHIGRGLLNNFKDFIPFPLDQRKLFLLTDENVNRLYAEHVLNTLREYGALPVLLTVKGGETSKSFSDFERLSNEILSHKVTRDSILIALGGGVVGDLGGFLASTIVRGIPYIQIPTTLLAQVDSSVGGKTAINTAYGKNLLGTFYQPDAVIIDPETLQTLSKREYRAGLAEIVKYGLINDLPFFEFLEENSKSLNPIDTPINMELCQTIILKSCAIKAKIVSEDEKETENARILLNLGHTFGHALELIAGYNGKILHGEGVSVGMMMAAQASLDLECLSKNDFNRIRTLLQSLGLPVSISDLDLDPLKTDINILPEQMYDLMLGDKKAIRKGIRFILFDGAIGQTNVRSDLSQDFVLNLIKKCINLD